MEWRTLERLASLGRLAPSHCRLGNREAAEQIFQEITERARTGYVGWSEQGAIAASAGRLDEARTLVARGIEARESYVAFESCPAWGPLRADAEGRKLLDAAGPCCLTLCVFELAKPQLANPLQLARLRIRESRAPSKSEDAQ